MKSSDSQVNYYRVNRRGQEIFSGDEESFTSEIAARRIKADDLIFDTNSQNWTFARNHSLFIGYAGEEAEQLKVGRRTQKKKPIFLRLLIAAGLMSFLLYSIAEYAKRWEKDFKMRETSFGGNQQTNQSSPIVQTAEDELNAALQSAELAATGELTDPNKLEENATARSMSKQQREDIELVFDLDSIEHEQSIALVSLVEQEIALRDEVLIEQIKKILNHTFKTRTQTSELRELNQLTRAIGYANFVDQRSIRISSTPHQEARQLKEQLSQRFRTRCEQYHRSTSLCALKLSHPTWHESAIRAIIREQVMVGMSRVQALKAWGEPQKWDRSTKGIVKACFDKECLRHYSLKNNTVLEVKIPQEKQPSK